MADNFDNSDIISGKTLNEKYKDIKFYVPLYDDLTSNSFTYQLGENIDELAFSQDIEHRKSHIRFYEETMCGIYLSDSGLNKYAKIALVKIPDDAKVYIDKYGEECQFETDKLTVIEINNYEDMSDEFWIKILENDGSVFKFIKEQNEQICISAVKNWGNNLKYVKKQTDIICETAVNNDGYALFHVEYQTDRICEIAVRQKGCVLKYVRNQTDKICETAVNNDGNALVYVKNQTERICELAVGQNGSALEFVKKQTKRICELAVQRYRFAMKYVWSQFFTEELCILAVQENRHAITQVADGPIIFSDSFMEKICRLSFEKGGYSLEFIKNQSEIICAYAVQKNWQEIRYVKKEFLTEKICELTAQQKWTTHGLVKKQNWMALGSIKKENQTEKVCEIFIRQNAYALKYVENQTDVLCELAVSLNGLVLVDVRNQTEKICTLAVQQNGAALRYVKDEFKEICEKYANRK